MSLFLARLPIGLDSGWRQTRPDPSDPPAPSPSDSRDLRVRGGSGRGRPRRSDVYVPQEGSGKLWPVEKCGGITGGFFTDVNVTPSGWIPVPIDVIVPVRCGWPENRDLFWNPSDLTRNEIKERLIAIGLFRWSRASVVIAISNLGSRLILFHSSCSSPNTRERHHLCVTVVISFKRDNLNGSLSRIAAKGN